MPPTTLTFKLSFLTFSASITSLLNFFVSVSSARRAATVRMEPNVSSATPPAVVLGTRADERVFRHFK